MTTAHRQIFTIIGAGLSGLRAALLSAARTAAPGKMVNS
ncbi:hypothetical protein SAMN04488568_11025 [Maricaulis salignorans]|uniref:Uncharacterized protein n=1 Tax=Maricaulis salignorans TaxID=144026 RepID=A0A1G9SPE0_9PROT|nr:hypothetical protein SAMN04488568_11025 [Maricaulis salignorans]